MGRWADKTFEFMGGEIILPVKGAETNPATFFRPLAVSDDPFTPLSSENSQSKLEIQAHCACSLLRLDTETSGEALERFREKVLAVLRLYTLHGSPDLPRVNESKLLEPAIN
ncbi:MAG TPA: hypothetical protein PK843_14885 [bacterium]|nr:hypothetical protein [bacterium]HPN35797.1 hypothetical protein [bacterium]